MTSTREKVARARWAHVNDAPEDHWDSVGHVTKDTFLWSVTDTINTFLKAAAEQGWHMRPDKATEAMKIASTAAWLEEKPPTYMYCTMLAAAPEYEWDK